ncbi:uncharacterized protein LOC124937810 [Impatiens glandulifera]|uniref:uncharacterized protein LOC124937810 n=1 Tax=Impatiens glandulifera TaxID=253017 RepID=UPI001FB1749D|nr:uncharacterized protein LOC124937810 [Impatiens glandulifera]
MISELGKKKDNLKRQQKFDQYSFSLSLLHIPFPSFLSPSSLSNRNGHSPTLAQDRIEQPIQISLSLSDLNSSVKTMQKFKLLATQCAVMTSPTRSPATSPVINLRRRKTLRMLLTRGGSGRRLKESTDRPASADLTKKSKELNVGNKLKDFLVSSSSPIHDDSVSDGGIILSSPAPAVSGGDGTIGGHSVWRRFGQRPPPSSRPFTATFRQRLMRRPFRPVLVAIPEIE